MGNKVLDDRKKTITMMSVELAFRNDEELFYVYRNLPKNPFLLWIPEVSEKNSLFEIRYALDKRKIIPMTDDATFPAEYIKYPMTKKANLLSLFGNTAIASVPVATKKKDCTLKKRLPF